MKVSFLLLRLSRYHGGGRRQKTAQEGRKEGRPSPSPSRHNNNGANFSSGAHVNRGRGEDTDERDDEP